LSTLTELFNLRIGASRKALFVEKTQGGFRFLHAFERLPLRDEVKTGFAGAETLQDFLGRDDFSESLNVYYLLSPRDYYRCSMTFPFSERLKIDAIIGYEIRDYLPRLDLDCLTDFVQSNGHVTAFSVERSRVRAILSDFGGYTDNLRGIVPYDAAIRYAADSLAEEDPSLFLIMDRESVYLQSAEKGRIRRTAYVETGGDGELETEDVDTLLTHLRTAVRDSGIETVHLVREASAGAESADVLYEGIERLGLTVRPLALGRLEDKVGGVVRDASYLPLFGALLAVNQPPPGRVNLLRGEFKPRPKGFVSLKEFAVAGILLILLAVISTVGLSVDLRFSRNQARRLEESLRGLSGEVFGREIVETAEARRAVQALRDAIDRMESATDTSLSGLRLLRELSLYFPGDVVVEYTDIVVEKDRIRLSGRARAFSDIDRMERDLLMSDLFERITVVNTGTTGSTEGYTVSFVIDITVGGV
jgi:hypothetical protein